MTHLEKIARAKSRLMLEHPYFGTVASALKLQQSDNVESFLSNGIQLQFNKEYFQEASLEEVEFALANGAMHTVLRHQSRAGERHGKLWQLATDYTINAMLVKNGLQLPDRANYQQRFEGMYAEEVYALLRSELDDNTFTDDSTEIKETNDNKNEHSAETSETPDSHHTQKRDIQDNNSSEAEMDEEYYEQLFQKLKRQGDLPKDLKFVVPHYFSHQIDWRELLYRHIASYAKSTYAFMPPNMKYLYRGIYLPSLSSDLLRIVIAIDTSGSIDEKLLALFLSEVTSIMQNYPNYEIDLVTADAKVQQHHTFLPSEPLSYELKGGGGTDFRPLFEYVERHISYPTLLLYFTDGQGRFPETASLYDVIWVMPHKGNVPFGEVISLHETQ